MLPLGELSADLIMLGAELCRNWYVALVSLAIRSNSVQGTRRQLVLSHGLPNALGIYPDVTRRLRAEALELLRRNPTPSFSEIENMQYLSNFTRETLRVNCPGRRCVLQTILFSPTNH